MSKTADAAIPEQQRQTTIATRPPIDEKKLNQVLTWILEGNSEHIIREAIEETWPGEKSRPLMIAAAKRCHRDAGTLRKRVADWCLAATHFLYQKQVENGDYAGAMRAVDQISKLTSGKGRGGNATSPVTVNVGVQLSADDRERRITEICNAALERGRADRVIELDSAARPADG